MAERKERLQKVIAQSGLTSRRKAEKLIEDGRVKVNGKVITKLGTRVSLDDDVRVDDVPIEKEEKVYFLLYKPRGVITSVSDDRNRRDISDLMKNVSERVFPVGRLDYHSSGALVVTNDGTFANLLMHPRYEMEKVYHVNIKGIPDEKTLLKLIKGVQDGKDLLRITQYKVISVDRKKNQMALQLHLHEGKNRHIRRMMNNLGYPIIELKRNRFGFLTLEGLNPGQYRKLKQAEVNHLKQIALQNVNDKKKS